MKAAVCTKHGAPDVVQIKEIAKPVPGPKQVLVKIVATTVTSGDAALRGLGLIQFILMWPIARFVFGIKNQRKKILGHEFSGIIESVGRDVTRFKDGEQVFGVTGFQGGAHGEYICLPEDAVLTQKPAEITHEQTAAVPIGGISALVLLQKGKFQPGQHVLVYGASGSIGTYAVQLARSFGASVTGVCSSKHLDLVKSLGAETVIDYTKKDFTRDNKTYDLIFDTVGKMSASRCKKRLKKNGRFVSTHSSPVNIKQQHLIVLTEQIKAGKVRPVIDRFYNLKDIAKAHRYVDTGHKAGNVIITMEATDEKRYRK